MRGFTGFYHYGHPCFIREEYESEHCGEDDLARLEDALGMSFSDFNAAAYYALTHARHLLYRCESDDIDNELLAGRDPWVMYRNGYVHIVTGEFVPGFRPNRDSYPCWKTSEPVGDYFDCHSAVQLSGVFGALAMVVGLFAAVLGGKEMR